MRRRSRAAAAVGVVVALALCGGVTLLARSGSPAPIAPPPVAPAIPVVRQSQGAIALARQDGNRVVALSLRRAGAGAQARVTVLGPAGGGVTGLAVALDGGVRARPCGGGCYGARLRHAGRTVVVHVRGPGERAARVAFALPRAWPVAAGRELAGVQRALRGATSVVYRERLASAPGRALMTLWRAIAPDRLAYSADNGTAGIVIGDRRWDRDSAGGPWLRSPQDRLRLPTLPWSTHVQNVVRLDPPPGRGSKIVRFALFDPATPAWYEVTADARSHRLRSVHMTAASHFMRDDYLSYDSAPPIRPPIRARRVIARHSGRPASKRSSPSSGIGSQSAASAT